MLRWMFVLMVLSAGLARAQAPGIEYYPTWDSALAQARAQQRPILLIAATPHCHNVPGMW